MFAGTLPIQPSRCREIAARTRPDALGGVRAIGVDEHVRRIAGHTFVTVIVDPAPVRERRDPSRARGTVPGSCEQALRTWLEGRPDSWKAGIEVVAMDGIGWAPSSAAAEELLGSTPREPPPRPPKPWTSADNAPAGRSGAARGRAGAPCTGRSAPSSLRPPCSHPTRQDRRKEACSTTRPIPGWN